MQTFPATLRVLCIATTAMIMGCTTIGVPDAAKMGKIDFGAPVPMRVCLLKDREISRQRTDEIKAALQEELRPYGIEVMYPWVAQWDRPGFWSDTQVSGIVLMPLVPPCDRIFGLAGRHTGDFFWGIIMPEILGAVEGKTFTRGFAVVEWGSLNQLLSFAGPESNAVHEGYHLLGCGHGLVMDDCYEQIRTMKIIAVQERERGNDFFPTISSDGYILRTREEVDDEWYRYIQTTYAPDSQSNKDSERPASQGDQLESNFQH
jgi:hypothetical protein